MKINWIIRTMKVKRFRFYCCCSPVVLFSTFCTFLIPPIVMREIHFKLYASCRPIEARNQHKNSFLFVRRRPKFALAFNCVDRIPINVQNPLRWHWFPYDARRNVDNMLNLRDESKFLLPHEWKKNKNRNGFACKRFVCRAFRHKKDQFIFRKLCWFVATDFAVDGTRKYIRKIVDSFIVMMSDLSANVHAIEHVRAPNISDRN